MRGPCIEEFFRQVNTGRSTATNLHLISAGERLILDFGEVNEELGNKRSELGKCRTDGVK
jgi:hypothetical protein